MKPFRIGVRNRYRPAYRSRSGRDRFHTVRNRTRPRYRVAAQLRHGARFWAPIPNMAGPLCTLVRQILKFHESQPILMNPELKKRSENGPISDSGPQPNVKNRSENGQFWSDSEKLNDVQPSTSNFQLTEGALYEKMLQSASAITEHIQKHPRRVTLFQLAKIYELASILGRRAVGMPLDGNETKKPEPRIVRPEIEEALNRVYGPPPQNN